MSITRTFDTISLTRPAVYNDPYCAPCSKKAGARHLIIDIAYDRTDADHIVGTIRTDVRGYVHGSAASGYTSYYDRNHYEVEIVVAGYVVSFPIQYPSDSAQTIPAARVQVSDNSYLVVHYSEDSFSCEGRSPNFTVRISVSYINTQGTRSKIYEKSYTLTAPEVSKLTMTRYSSLSSDVVMEISHDVALSTGISHQIDYRTSDDAPWNSLGTAVISAGDLSTTFTWRPPLTLAVSYPNDTTLKLTFRCTTYYDGVALGYKQRRITLKIPNLPPSINSVTLTPRTIIPTSPANPAPRFLDWDIFIRGFSRVQFAVNASGQWSATIAKISVNINGKEYSYTPEAPLSTTDILDVFGTIPVVVTATDSRGYISTYNTTIHVWDYSPPVLSDESLFRCDNTGLPEETGEYMNVSATKTYCPLDGNNTCRITVKYAVAGSTPGNEVELMDDDQPATQEQEGEAVETAGGDSTVTIPSVATVIGNSENKLLVGNNYTVVFTISDEFNSYIVQKVLYSVNIAFNIKDGGRAIAFGSYASIDDSVHIAGGLQLIGNSNIYGDELPSTGTNEGRLFFHVEDGGQNAGFYRCTPYVYTDGSTYNEQSDDAHPTIFDLIYPVGSIYMSMNNTDPGILFGGEWRKIQNAFLLSSGSRTAGDTGGEESHALTVQEIPPHRHNIARYNSASGETGGNFGSYNTSTGANNARSWVGAPSGYEGGQNTTDVSAGTVKAHNNMPPYLVVNVWQRISLKKYVSVPNG